MLPGLRHSALRLGQVMAPLTSAACGGRQMTITGGWGLQNAGLWQRGRHTSVARASAAVAQPLTYQITDTTQLLLQRGDITLFEGDAIVNAGADLRLVSAQPQYLCSELQFDLLGPDDGACSLIWSMTPCLHP